MKKNLFVYQLGDLFKKVEDLPSWLLKNYTVHQQMRLLREALGMTQTQLAKLIKAKQSAIAKIENDPAHDMQLSTLKKIAEALNCELVVNLVPKRDIHEFLEEKAKEKAAKLISQSTGSTALELQKPDQKYIELQIEELKKEILEKHRKTLWEK